MQLFCYGGDFMEQYIMYIKELLHINVSISKFESHGKLPLYLSKSYEFCILTIYEFQCLLARPISPTNLTALRKQCMHLKKLTGLECVLCLQNVRIYTKEKMLSEGTPFIIAGQQIYMPFLGVALAGNKIKDISHIDKISFSTQKLLLTAIYNDWKKITLTEVANVLCVSKMTVTRCFNELQALGLSLVHSGHKLRYFTWQNDRRSLWEFVRPHLRDPVFRQYFLDEKLTHRLMKLSGMSAISHYSMLSDNNYVTYGVTKDTAKSINLHKIPEIPKNESPSIIIQIMGYEYDYRDLVAIDPLSAILSLTDDDLNDPRVEAAVEEILEECLYD